MRRVNAARRRTKVNIGSVLAKLKRRKKRFAVCHQMIQIAFRTVRDSVVARYIDTVAMYRFQCIVHGLLVVVAVLSVTVHQREVFHRGTNSIFCPV